MKRFIATLNGESYINIPADWMVFNQDSNMVMVYNGQAWLPAWMFRWLSLPIFRIRRNEICHTETTTGLQIS